MAKLPGAAAERTFRVVPRRVMLMLALALGLQFAWHARQPAPSASAAALPEAPAPRLVRMASLDEPVAAAQLLLLYLQAYDNQPGISIPFLELDYPRVIGWLDTALVLDPRSSYALVMAAQIYGQVPDAARQRAMCAFVERAFFAAPDRRWRWLAHCAIMAKHRLQDPALALRYATAITEQAGAASSWARQMRIFILEDMGEIDSAKVLLGGLLAQGEITDPAELHLLAERLKALESAGLPTAASKNRHPGPTQ